MKKRTILLLSLLGLTIVLEACNMVSDAREGNKSRTQTTATNQTQINQTTLPSGSNTTVSSESYIGETRALEIALEHAGVSSSDLLFTKNYFEYDDRRAIYDVEFYAGMKEYDYEIDAVNGNILSFDADMENDFIPPANTAQAPAANQTQQTQQQTTAQPAQQSSAQPTQKQPASQPAQQQSAPQPAQQQPASQPAQQPAQQQPAPQPAQQQPAPQPAQQQPAPQPAQQQPAPQPAQQKQSSGASVSLESATQIALGRVPGATSSHIRIKQEWDDGRAVYEGKIIYNQMEYDFEIDATTGNVTEWDAESIYD